MTVVTVMMTLLSLMLGSHSCCGIPALVTLAPSLVTLVDKVSDSYDAGILNKSLCRKVLNIPLVRYAHNHYKIFLFPDLLNGDNHKD